MDVDTIIQEIKKMSPLDKRRVEAALGVIKGNGAGQPDSNVLASERVRRFDSLIGKMPALTGSTVDASRDSIYD